VQGTGAVAVAGNLNTYYEDIKSGVSDGASPSATGAWGAKVHEVAPYITKVNFGSSSRAALP
jgi:TRAP-type C4-dicarboxylate transport system substrate-binding protein